MAEAELVEAFRVQGARIEESKSTSIKVRSNQVVEGRC